MSKLSNLLRRGIAKLWLVGIALLVLIALFVSAVRAALPYLNQYQHQVSDYIATQHQVNVSMSQVIGEWKNGGPTVTIVEPTFHNLETLGVDFSAKKLAFQLNIPQSIMALAPRFNWVEVNQAKVLLGEFPQGKSGSDDPIPLLLNVVKTVDFDDLNLSFSSFYGKLPPLHLSKLRWLGSESKKQIQLEIAADKRDTAPLSLLVDLFGDSRDNLSGKAYIHANQWQWRDDLSFVLSSLSPESRGQASFEMWLDFSLDSVDSMMLSLGENQLDWVANQQPQQLSIEPIAIQWQPGSQGWNIAANKIQLALNHQPLLPIDLLMTQQHGQVRGEISQLDLQILAPLSGLFTSLPDDTKKLLAQLSPGGAINNLQVHHESQQWHYQGTLNNYSQQQVGGIPSVQDMSAQFSGVDTTGQAHVVMTQKTLDFGPYFKQPIALDALTTDLYWGHDTLRSWFGVSELSVKNKDLASQLAMQLVFEQNQSPVLSLYGEAQVNSAKHVDNYLPHVVLSDGLVDYLSQAIKAGQSDDVGLLWQGALNRFPYTDGDGAFEVNANVDKAKYQFHPDWRAVEDARVNLNFRNASMVITGQSGHLKQLEFEHLVTRIDDLLNEPTVIVDVHLLQSQQRINDFVFGSVIDSSVGAVLRELKVDGDVGTKLNINIPLDGSIPVVSGSVNLANNNIRINSLELDVKNTSGKVNFVNGEVTGNEISGVLFEQPVSFGVATKPIGADYYGIEIDLNGQWHSDKIPNHWHAYLDDYLTGSLDWQGRITLKIGEKDVNYQANFRSPMRGLELKLPKPLDKYVDQQESLRISTVGNAHGGQFNLALGSRAEVLADFTTDDKSVALSQMSLLVGRGFNAQDTIAKDGLSIKIDLDSLAVDEWQSFIDSIEEGQSQEQFFPPLKRIEAKVSQLAILDQNLTNVMLVSDKTVNGWNIDIQSAQAIGQLTMFDDTTRGIKARFERLIIDEKDDSSLPINQQATQLAGQPMTVEKLREMPLLDFMCLSCRIGGVEIGQLSFATKAVPQGIEVLNIEVVEANTALRAKALWGVDEQGEFTSVSGDLNSKELEKTLKLFGFSSGITDSGLKMDFALNWRGSFHQPQVSTIDGDISWKISEGHIAEVSDKGTRLFSLFSLDSLRRKLVLDFRDVFVKGIFYNDFKGSFNIENGVAVTHDAFMDGIAGGIDVVGSINLDSQELDYYVTFSPNLFSNIPVIAGVVTSTPQVFVLAFALTKVLKPIMDVISQVNFKVSGSIEDPQFVEINRQQKKYKVPPHILPKVEESVIPQQKTTVAVQGEQIESSGM